MTKHKVSDEAIAWGASQVEAIEAERAKDNPSGGNDFRETLDSCKPGTDVKEALKPFAEFASNVDEDGWTSNIHRESISSWFGPSDFRAAREAYRALSSPGDAVRVSDELWDMLRQFAKEADKYDKFRSDREMVPAYISIGALRRIRTALSSRPAAMGREEERKPARDEPEGEWPLGPESDYGSPDYQDQPHLATLSPLCHAERMAEHFDVEINDGGKKRTVRVIITVPPGQNFLHLGEIAQRAWDSEEKKVIWRGAIAKIDMRKR